MNTTEKVYVGTGKIITTQYGDMMKLSFTEKDIKTLQENLDNGWVNINVNKKKVAGEKGNTHYGVIDFWKPSKGVTTSEAKKIFHEGKEVDEIPF